MDNASVELFRARRSLIALQKFILEILTDLRQEHDRQIERVGESLIEMEQFLEEKKNIEIELTHLTKHFEFFGENQYNSARKKILDYAGDLTRSLSQ